MSERMNKEQAIEILEKIKSKSEEYIKNSQTRINTTDLTPLKNAFVRKQEYANKKVQALDIAIESLIKQSEYDMYTHNVEFQLKLAEKKLNELGYAFNEYRGCIIAIDKADKE